MLGHSGQARESAYTPKSTKYDPIVPLTQETSKLPRFLGIFLKAYKTPLFFKLGQE